MGKRKAKGDWTVERAIVIRGLPRGLARDAWWFGADEGRGGTLRAGDGAGEGGAGRGRGLALLLLLLLGDLLFFGHPPGLSLALYASAIFAVAAAFRRPGAPLLGPALVVIAGALPVIEYAQFLALLFLAAGLLAGIVWMHQGPGAGMPAAMVALLGRVPTAGPRSLAETWQGALRRSGKGSAARAWLRAWAVPLGGVLILTTLLADANPILAGWLDGLLRFQPDLGVILRRTLLWSGLGLIVWPLLDPAPLPLTEKARSPRAQLPGLNPQSVALALVLFNLVLGVQTVLDLAILWAGGSLPDGMSHAEYAHRGAYPLLATAFLAGAFALAARPWLEERPALMPLMALWLGQNVLLCLSALLRLRLYVEAFGLTYLRLYAAIWMALVAAGLALTFWQIRHRRANSWLVLRAAALGAGTLYLCTFINFGSLIAAHNLSQGANRDSFYLCELGETAAADLVYADLPCALDIPVTQGWRDWGFRKWRISRSLQAGRYGAGL